MERTTEHLPLRHHGIHGPTPLLGLRFIPAHNNQWRLVCSETATTLHTCDAARAVLTSTARSSLIDVALPTTQHAFIMW